MLISFRVPLRWSEVLKRTIDEIGADNCLGLAAQLAFYFFLVSGVTFPVWRSWSAAN